MPIPHNCTRQYQVVSYREESQPSDNSGWYLDRYFRDFRTTAERLELRRYVKNKTLPLLYTGACVAPNVVKRSDFSVTKDELSFPVIKAETEITGCDVDEYTINPQTGDKVSVGMDRYNLAFNESMSDLFDSQRQTHVHEAISLLRDGQYTLWADRDADSMGVVNFNRAPELSSIDLTGTSDDWSNPCSKPFKVIEQIIREMAKFGAIAGAIDIIYSALAWDSLEGHTERDGVKFGQNPIFGLGAEQSMFFEYSDVQFKGSTNGGVLNHWVDNTMYVDYNGELKPALAPGEIMIVSNQGFFGQRFWRTITSDNREELPSGSLPFFVYDGLDEYERKCRSYRPWLEEYHLMIPRNVNGALVASVVPEDYEPCIPCEECP